MANNCTLLYQTKAPNNKDERVENIRETVELLQDSGRSNTGCNSVQIDENRANGLGKMRVYATAGRR
jgi:hypothetical protein